MQEIFAEQNSKGGENINIFVIDDERLALRALCDSIASACPQNTVYCFSNASELLKCAQQTKCDVAFLDIELRHTSGLELAKKLKKIHPKVNIIFVTGHAEFAVDAFALHASGYLLKPVTAENICKELEDLRNPIQSSKDTIINV